MDQSSPPSYDELGFLAAQGILVKGVRVALTKDSNSSGGKGKGGGAQEEYGVLKFAAADLKFEAKKPKPRFSTTYLSSIRDVELQEKAITGLQEGNRCRVELKDKKDSGKIYTGPPPKTAPLMMPPRPSTFGELLDPLGLTDKYGAAFTASGIPIQNLGVVTREDLAELVGVTDRLDQINISAQIKRCFPDPVIAFINQGGGGPNGLEAGVRAVEGVSSLLGALLV